jgi:hypothetical protein
MRARRRRGRTPPLRPLAALVVLLLPMSPPSLAATPSDAQPRSQGQAGNDKREKKQKEKKQKEKKEKKAGDGGFSAIDKATGEALAPQTHIYFNARVALREGRHDDVLKLWLLRNALEEEHDEDPDPKQDSDFRSMLWVSLSAEGYCHDGLRADDDFEGAGLWPLAMFNYVGRSTARQPPPGEPRTFSSFDVDYQQRNVSLYDVLSVEELKVVRFHRGTCLRPWMLLPWLGTPHWLDLDDRLSRGIMMRDLIEKAGETLKHERVRGQVVLETRLFDIEVALARLAKAKAKREVGLMAQLARTTGISNAQTVLTRDKRLADVRQGQHAELLRRSLTWAELDWFSLSRNRRLALFGEAVDSFRDDVDYQEQLRAALLQNVDSLIRMEDGEELNQWLGFVAIGEPDAQLQPVNDEADKPEQTNETVSAARLAELKQKRREAIGDFVFGARGERLLSLDVKKTGFREHAVVALWRGVDYLERGYPLDAMRAFALAMKASDHSTRRDEVHNLAKRWFAYVLAVHRADSEALAIMETFLTPLDRNELLEVLMWRAAFHGDETSFERIADGVRKGGSLDFRVRHLRTLASGDVAAMYTNLREETLERPHALYKFVKVLIEELATESLDVRLRNRATFDNAMLALQDASMGANKGLRRRMDEQILRIQTMLDGLDLYDPSAEGRARRAAPGAESYAGAVRLAPSDPLPWPFVEPRVSAPSAFSALILKPVEWWGDDGERVFGWHIMEK